jgi:hypothetical protein
MQMEAPSRKRGFKIGLWPCWIPLAIVPLDSLPFIFPQREGSKCYWNQ